MDPINRFFERFPIRKQVLLLTLFAVLLSFYHLSGRFLISGDETRVAGIIRAMLLPGPWFLPKLNGSLFLEYPPLHYWGGAFFLSVFGVCDGAVKAMSATALCGSILVTYALARRLQMGKGTSFFAGIMLGFSISFFASGRTCTVDATLSFFVLLAVYGFYSGMTADSSRSRFFYYLLYAAAAGCAIMTKGLLGLALPGSILFFTLFFHDLSERKIHWRIWLALGFGSLAALIPVILWAVRLYQYLGYYDFYEVMYSNNIGRFTGSQSDHAEPFYYYLTRLPQLFQPWLVLLPFGIWRCWRKFRHNHELSGLFLLCAFLAPLLLFTLAAGKRQIYLLPVYPAAALLAAQGFFFLMEWIWTRIPVEKWIKPLQITAFLLLCLTAAASIILSCFHPPVWGWAVLPLLTALSGILFFVRGRESIGWAAVLLALALLFSFAEGVLPNDFNRKQKLEPLFQKVAELEKQGEKIYLLAPAEERTRGAAVYYLGKILPIRISSQYDGKSREIWLFRKRKSKSPVQYGDNHHLVRMPEGTAL